MEMKIFYDILVFPMTKTVVQRQKVTTDLQVSTVIIRFTIHIWLVVDLPLWKIFVTWGIVLNNMESHKIHVPNHQPDIVHFRGKTNGQGLSLCLDKAKWLAIPSSAMLVAAFLPPNIGHVISHLSCVRNNSLHRSSFMKHGWWNPIDL